MNIKSFINSIFNFDPKSIYFSEEDDKYKHLQSFSRARI